MKTNNENRFGNNDSDTGRDGKLTKQGDAPLFTPNADYDGAKPADKRNPDARRPHTPQQEGERKWQPRPNGGKLAGERQHADNSNRPKRPRFKPSTQGAKSENMPPLRKSPGDAPSGKYVETRFDQPAKGVTFRQRKQSENYDPNAKYSKKKRVEYRRQSFDPTQPIRLNKFLANAGVSSRREADAYIQAGVISVNGQVVTELGTKVLPTDKVMFHDQPVKIEHKIYLLLNKPKGMITTVEDTKNRKTVMEIVRHACRERIYPVGRLDRNTTGVLLLTNDGDLATKLTHPKYGKKKIYHLQIDKDITPDDFEKILNGVDLGDFKIKADALEFVKDGSLTELGIEIHSGQNRVVRRIFDSLGYKILKLDRVYFAGLTKRNLPRGKYRFLTEKEVNMLMMGAYE